MLVVLTMRIGIPALRDRISPVLDVSRHFLLVEAEGAEELSRREIDVPEGLAVVRAKQISKLGVDVLICGAISQSFEELLVSSGTRVIPNTCGKLEEVLSAFLSGQLTEGAYLMPGCSGNRRRSGRHR